MTLPYHVVFLFLRCHPDVIIMESKELTWTDTHCHLFVQEFDGDRTDMIHRAIGAGITQMMLPNIDVGTVEQMLSVCQSFPGTCYPMLGLHPCSVTVDYQDALAMLGRFFQTFDFAGIGETGIDLYWDTTFRSEQVKSFEQHIQWAKELNLPVIIHSRESLDLTIDIVRHHQDGRLKGIFHCFGGTIEQGQAIAELDFKMGIGGIITYKHSTLPAVLRELPLTSFVLETDSPYLAPVPFRGKRNEPFYLKYVAEVVSQALNLSLTEVSRITQANARAVFEKKA